MRCRAPVVVAAVVAVCLLLLASGPVDAQRAQSPLEIGGMTHTIVDGHSVVVVILSNNGPDTIEARGEFEMVDWLGSGVARVPVTTGPLPPGATSALAVPIPGDLDPGGYTASLSLEDTDLGVQANSGLREVRVGNIDPRTEPTIPPAGTEVELEEAPEGGGFPAWILLIIGLGMSVLGVTYMRSASSPRKPSQAHIPEVSMVRKVKVSTPPPKRPATIKPLLPQRRRPRD